MHRSRRTRIIAILAAAAFLAAACGGSRDDDAGGDVDAGASTTAAESSETTEGSGTDTTEGGEPSEATTTTEAAAADPCEGVTLEATETGVTADTITIVAMADVDSELAPGLFKGAWDGLDAWANHVNAEGGIACRQIEVIQHDSKLNPTETTNGFLRACEDALALVGTTVLFSTDTSDLNSCADGAGEGTGVPDLAYITTEASHQCSANSFHMARPGASCPYESGERNYSAAVGAMAKVQELEGDLSGIFIVPGDLPSTIAASFPNVLAQVELGIEFVETPRISGRATQADFGAQIQTLRENDSTFVYNGSNDQAILKLQKEAAAQGLDTSDITMMCSLSCYTPDFIEQGGDVVEGTYVWMSFVPFDEASDNAELGDFMTAIDDPFPAAWAAGAWADGVLLEDALNAIVEADGPNAITRAALLGQLRTITDFDANEWWGRVDLTRTDTISDCFVLLQVTDGAFQRVFPEAPGTLDCDASNVASVAGDPADF